MVKLQSYKVRLDTFLNEFLIDFNAAQAAIRIGVSKAASKATGCKYLSAPYTQERLQARIKQSETETNTTRADVLNGLR